MVSIPPGPSVVKDPSLEVSMASIPPEFPNVEIPSFGVTDRGFFE